MISKHVREIHQCGACRRSYHTETRLHKHIDQNHVNNQDMNTNQCKESIKETVKNAEIDALDENGLEEVVENHIYDTHERTQLFDSSELMLTNVKEETGLVAQGKPLAQED